jgi:hypothetical protein
MVSVTTIVLHSEGSEVGGGARPSRVQGRGAVLRRRGRAMAKVVIGLLLSAAVVACPATVATAARSVNDGPNLGSVVDRGGSIGHHSV